MTKEEFIQQYIDEFFEGKSESVRTKFLAKPVEKQYASIMTWRSRNKKGADITRKEENLKSYLKGAFRVLKSTPRLEKDEMNELFNILEELKHELETYRENQRMADIAALEREKEALEYKLRLLRGE